MGIGRFLACCRLSSKGDRKAVEETEKRNGTGLGREKEKALLFLATSWRATILMTIQMKVTEQ